MLVRAGHRPAAVRQDRHPQRDGDRGRRVRPGPAPRHPAGRHRHRLGRADAAPGDRGRGVPRRPSWTGRRAAADVPPDVATEFGRLVAAAASPIDDVRGTAAYRRHALAVMARPLPGLGLDRLPEGGRLMRVTVHRQRRAARGRRRLGGREPALRPARADGPARLEERLRAGRVRLVHGLPRRRPCLRVPGRRRPGRGSRGRHRRGARRRGRRAAPGPAGVRRRRRRAVRVLHAGAGGRHPRPARPRPGPRRRRDPRGAGRQPVPVHRLREDHRRRAAGRGGGCR